LLSIKIKRLDKQGRVVIPKEWREKKFGDEVVMIL